MIKVANAPCSWGVLEFDFDGEVIGYAQVLDEIHETGYAGTELGDWGFMPTDPDVLKRELTSRKLELLGAFVPVALADSSAHPKGVETAVRTAEFLAAVSPGKPFIILADDNGKDPMRTQYAGRIRSEQGLTDNQWLTFATGVEQIAQTVKTKTGLRVIFHHHCAGFVETPAEIEKLMNLTDPNLLGLCFDTGHYRFGGGNPIAGLKIHGDRIWHVHFKDCQPQVAAKSRAEQWDYFQSVQQGVFCELGRGNIDFSSVLAELSGMKYEGWIVVEQDVLPGMGSPSESARHNREFLRHIGLDENGTLNEGQF